MLTFNSKSTIAIGEAMIEMAVIGEDTYRRSFAGDTFNTAWHMSQLLGPDHPVGFATKVGSDTVSRSFISELAGDGLDVSCVEQDTTRTMGLYLIELDCAERQFHYWRSQSAARLLADDTEWLARVTQGAGLIHVSGITLAILSAEARARLWRALSQARADGARVSFDPNVRPKLWSSMAEVRETLTGFLELTDIILPSFDDEATVWGDASPEVTCRRYASAGIAEIAIKNGVGPVIAQTDGRMITAETAVVSDVKDTTGAGDAFNAGYLAARLSGRSQSDAIAMGQRVSAQVIRNFGARIPKDQIPELA